MRVEGMGQGCFLRDLRGDCAHSPPLPSPSLHLPVSASVSVYLCAPLLISLPTNLLLPCGELPASTCGARPAGRAGPHLGSPV